MIYQNHTLHMKGQNFENFMSIKKVFEKDSNIMIYKYVMNIRNSVRKDQQSFFTHVCY